MNPPNPFGSPQGGAFQAPNNTMKTGLFQSLGQQSSSNQGQTLSFFQSNRLPSFVSRPPTQGNNIFGQTPAFGQQSTQPPAFGQQTLGMTGSGFGGGTAPAFGQTSGPRQSSTFGQTPTFGQASGFGKPFPAFGQQPTGFGNTQISTGSQSQTLGFGQPAFGQPSSTSATTSVFGTAQTVTQSRGFGPTEFSFKPSNEVLFKPIFSASPESSNPKTTSLSSSPFSGSTLQTTTSSSTSTGFSLLPGAKSGPLGFSFSQPAAAPSVSAQANPPATGTSSSPATTLQFTFSQPAAPSSSSAKTSTAEPTTPSSFSFTAKTLQPQPVPLFRATGFGQPSAFSDTKAETSTDDKGFTSPGDTNTFAQFSKATKRKEQAGVSRPEKVASDEGVSPEKDSPRHPAKRQLMRSRGPPGGLFSRALSSLRKENSKPMRREIVEQRQEVEREKGREESQGESSFGASPAALRPVRDVQAITEESDPASTAVVTRVAQPRTPARRTESTDSLSGVSPVDCTGIICRNVPPALNKKDIIEKHFGSFGRIQRIFCRPNKGMTIVHFDDHASAAKAKKRGKVLHRKEILIVWQRKKQSPEDKLSRSDVKKEETEEKSQEDAEAKATPSPLRRPPLRTPTMGARTSSPVMKPSPVKALQFDSEHERETTTETQTPERPIPSSLLPLLGLVAETTEDKYRLLEQRDKILRQGRPKRTDLHMSKVFVGTCPDMCPEKERYIRETRNQLSTFEVIPQTEMVDHTAAIKEYSRSSADQEEPLSHELRPLPVLSMTMDYLVTQIMDQSQEKYRDWYDFVWNRTRGIRKDITQQHLCCPHTVSLIEKCTRFHVHCAHHLCEEPMSSFDAKINNENMTKCLQSLKEMYQDLAARQIFCPNEAELRQYSVLLKLNDGDILREVQQFRDEVRNSPQVKFAVQAFSAVNSNNFVRFFKLVKGASYMASCLLHRYFNQVRAKALKTLNIAHTVGPRSTAFPVDDIVRLLMFRDVHEATDFIQQYGLNVNDGMVELSRLSYQEPELPLSQRKSEVIFAKRTVLIGEVVHGSPLPNPPQHVPVCSFDPQNRYRGDAGLAESTSVLFKATPDRVNIKVPPKVEFPPQVVPVAAAAAAAFVTSPAVPDETGEPSVLPAESQLFQPLSQPRPIKPPSPPPKPQYTDEDVMAELDSVIEEVVDETVKEVVDAGVAYTTTALVESGAQMEVVVSEVLGQMLRELSSTEIRLEQERIAEEKRKLEEARRRQEHEAFLAQFSVTLCSEIVCEVLDETVQETAAAEIQEAVNEKAERVAKCTEQVCLSLIEEALDADIALLVEDFLEAELQRIHKYIKRWRDVVAVRRQLKRQMRGFPAAPCCVDPRFKLKALAPSAPPQPSIADLARGLVSLGNAGTLSLSSTRVFKMRQEALHLMRVHCFYQQLLDESVWAPLHLPALVTENIPSPPERIFWKAVLLLPSEEESVASLADRILSDWLEVKFGGDQESEVRDEQPDGMLQTLCLASTLQEHAQQTHEVYLSVKASRGPLTEDSLSKTEECSELQGTSALIILLPALPLTEAGQEEQDVPLLSALLQLKQLQQVSSWHCPLPLVVLVPGPERGAAETQKLEEALMLQTLIKDGLISEFTFVFIRETTSDLQGSKQLIQAVRWLAARAPPAITLSCQTLVHVIESSLTREFSPRVYSHCQERVEAKLSPQDPGPVVQLYNAVLAHIANKISSQDLCRLSWPPGEFCLPDMQDFVPHKAWNSPQHLAWLSEATLTLQLPPWEKIPATASWSEICSSIFGYAAQIPVSDHSQPLLMSQLENLLERVRIRNQQARTLRVKRKIRNGSGDDAWMADPFIPWDDVLVICIDHKLKDWHIPRPPVCDDAVTEDGEILVYFPMEALKGFRPPEEWTEAVRQTHREKQQEGRVTEAASVLPATPALRQRLFPTLVEPSDASSAPLDITHTPTPQELLAHKVLQNLEKEKAESKRMMEQLQRHLDGDPVEQLSTPHFIPSSTLLSMPTTVPHTPTRKNREACLTQELESEELLEKSVRALTPKATISMEWRLKELQRQIAASKREEAACSLKLNNLLSIIDD
ncbi:germinal-center associated nuclear protein isoform 2-T2 [Pholidichthys leucotaenia]